MGGLNAASPRTDDDVLAVLVRAADDKLALSEALSAVQAQTVRPAHVVLVTIGPEDAGLAGGTLAPLAVPDGTSFGDALSAAAEHAAAQLGSEAGWIWALTPDSAPPPDCLASLLAAADAAPTAQLLQPQKRGADAVTSGQPGAGSLVTRTGLRSFEPVVAVVPHGPATPQGQTGAVPAENRPAPAFRDPELAAAQQRAQADREAELEAERDRAEPGERLRAGLRRFVTAPLLWLLLFLSGMTFAVNRGRIGSAVSGGGLLPAPAGGDTLLRSYLQDWHSVAGGTAAPAPALSGLLGLLGVPFGGADHAVAVLLLAAMPLAGLSAYLATRASRVGAGQRAILAALWALLPVGASASGYGRLDTLFTYILLPLVLAGVLSVLRGAPARVDSRGRDTGRSRWLSTTAATALALAVLSSAAPLMYLLIVAVVLVGFVLLRPAPGTGIRRAAALFFVVLLPVGLLLPWPAVLLAHPAVFLHGVGSTGGSPSFSLLQLAMLGYGIPAVAGVLVVLSALLMLISAPSFRMLPCLAVVLFGAAAAVGVAGQRRARLVDGTAVAGNPGPALLLMAVGLFLIIMVGMQEHARRALDGMSHPRVKAALALAVIGLLAVGAVLGGTQGGVRARPDPALSRALTAELVGNRALVLSTGSGDQPARISSPTLAELGDDDLVPTPAAVRRIAGWSEAITTGGETVAATAIAEAAASGVGALVLPAGARAASGAPAQLLDEAGRTSDGRTVFRVRLPALGARVLEPALATPARTGGQVPGSTGSTAAASRGTTMVPGGPPNLGVRVSGGPDGRLLVLAADDDGQWKVRMDGVAVAVAPAYGHLVGVALPGAASEVTVQRSDTIRGILLVVQAGLLLFTLLLAVPPRRRARVLSPASSRPARPRAPRRGRWSLRRRRGK